MRMPQNRLNAYEEWMREVIRRMPHLSKPQAVVLAMWSFGIAITQTCGLTSVSVFLAELFEQPAANIRERLRQWYSDKSTKEHRKRAQIEVSECFAPLLKWVLSLWPPNERRLVLAADATTLGQRFTLLVVSVVCYGCGIPVAWTVIRATEAGSWQPYWLGLLGKFKGCLGDEWTVLVTTDRGLYAKWFYDAICDLHWHPFMRINACGYYQNLTHPQSQWQPLNTLITAVGQHWTGTVSCFKGTSLSCTLLARWDEGYADPWLIVTDLPPEQASIYWYSLRSWIECLFKDIKRGGFGWHHTKMECPQRAERLWLAIAVATLWLVSVGGRAEGLTSASSLCPEESRNREDCHTSKPATCKASSSSTIDRPHSNPRWLSCFRRGALMILAALLKGLSLTPRAFETFVYPPFHLVPNG